MPKAVQNYEPLQTVQMTLASLANGSAREGAAVNLQAVRCTELMLQVTIKLATGTPAGSKAINVYVAGSNDGSTWGDNATGADAALTMRNPTNLIKVATINTPDAGALTYESQPVGLAQFFGGLLPRAISVVVENQSGLALNAAGNSVTVTPLFLTGN